MPSRRVMLPALLLSLFGVFAGLVVTAPAQATSSLLCQGFTGCAKAGYGSFGYGPTNYRKMWWRMYSGHNCTNYVSYRMIQAGMPSTRPWSGSGDARNWGVVFRSKTNQTPMVGSVAWWSSNHVAYVQQIVDANTIIISEDHYGGDFDWRKIVRSGGGWPTGFIHLVDETVKATTPPSVTGTPQVDQTLTAKPGAWNQTGTTYAYQWLANGTAITGATTTRYVPTPDQVGDVFTVKVTAKKAGYKAGASTSRATTAAIPGVLDVVTTPVISGVAKVGATLTASTAAFTPAPDTTRYSWYADGKYVAGGSSSTLTLGPALLGKVLRVVVTASRAGYNDQTAPSAVTAKVGPEKLSLSKEPRLLGNPHVGRAFAVTPGVVAPEGTTTAYQWFKDGVAIRGANQASYTPTTEDPGARLSVTVSYTKPGYTTIVRELTPKQAVRSYARIYLKSLAHRSVTVSVLADGVTYVHGEVTLIGRTGVKHTLTLVHGKATFTPSWLYAGSRPLTVTYAGSFRVEGRTQSKTVVVQ
ncbi:MAG: CHAP domain-containing protein [Marmoricola sp.]